MAIYSQIYSGFPEVSRDCADIRVQNKCKGPWRSTPVISDAICSLEGKGQWKQESWDSQILTSLPHAVPIFSPAVIKILAEKYVAVDLGPAPVTLCWTVLAHYICMYLSLHVHEIAHRVPSPAGILLQALVLFMPCLCHCTLA